MRWWIEEHLHQVVLQRREFQLFSIGLIEKFFVAWECKIAEVNAFSLVVSSCRCAVVARATEIDVKSACHKGKNQHDKWQLFVHHRQDGERCAGGIALEGDADVVGWKRLCGAVGREPDHRVACQIVGCFHFAGVELRMLSHLFVLYLDDESGQISYFVVLQCLGKRAVVAFDGYRVAEHFRKMRVCPDGVATHPKLRILHDCLLKCLIEIAYNSAFGKRITAVAETGGEQEQSECANDGQMCCPTTIIQHYLFWLLRNI